MRQASFLFTPYWPELSPRATASCMEGGEMWSLTGQPHGQLKFSSCIIKGRITDIGGQLAASATLSSEM